jgi:hypothetical protein
MVSLTQLAIQLVAIDALDGDANLLGELDNLAKRSGLLGAGGDQQPLEGAAPGAQRLAHGVPAIEQIGHRKYPLSGGLSNED